MKFSQRSWVSILVFHVLLRIIPYIYPIIYRPVESVMHCCWWMWTPPGSFLYYQKSTSGLAGFWIQIKHTLIHKNVESLILNCMKVLYTCTSRMFSLDHKLREMWTCQEAFSTAVLLISMSLFSSQSSNVLAGCSSSITSKFTWILIRLLIQVCYCNCGAISQLRTTHKTEVDT